MKSVWSFPVQIFTTLLFVGGVSSYPLVLYGTGEMITGAVVGAILATVNVFLSYITVLYAFNKSTATFFKVVVGGMSIRLLVMAIVLVILIKFFHLHVVALMVSIGIFYVIYLVLEILYIQKKINSKRQTM